MIKVEKGNVEIYGPKGLVMAEFNEVAKALVIGIGEDKARIAFEDGVAEAKGQTSPTEQKLDEAIDKAIDELLKVIFSGGDNGSCN